MFSKRARRAAGELGWCQSLHKFFAAAPSLVDNGLCCVARRHRAACMPDDAASMSTLVLPPTTATQLACAVRERRSTAGEDLLLLPLLLRAAMERRPQPPTFIEIGAFDGLSGSQTLVMERCFGWHGALIEASPKNYASLLSSNRTGAMAHYAVCSKPEGGTINIAGGTSTVAGDLSKMGKTHIRRWASARGSEVSQVPCKPLLMIYEDAMARSTAASSNDAALWRRGAPITYLSLDVEGSELDVLSSVPDLASQPFDFLLVENEYNNARDRAVDALLVKSGYEKFSMPQPPMGGTNGLYAARWAAPLATRLLGNRTARSGRWSGAYHAGEAALRHALLKMHLDPSDS